MGSLFYLPALVSVGSRAVRPVRGAGSRGVPSHLGGVSSPTAAQPCGHLPGAKAGVLDLQHCVNTWESQVIQATRVGFDKKLINGLVMRKTMRRGLAAPSCAFPPLRHWCCSGSTRVLGRRLGASWRPGQSAGWGGFPLKVSEHENSPC